MSRNRAIKHIAHCVGPDRTYASTLKELLHLRYVQDAETDSQRLLESLLFADLSGSALPGLATGTEFPPVASGANANRDIVDLVESVDARSEHALTLAFPDWELPLLIASAAGLVVGEDDFEYPVIPGKAQVATESIDLQFGDGRVRLTAGDGSRVPVSQLDLVRALRRVEEATGGRRTPPEEQHVNAMLAGAPALGSMLIRRLAALRGPRCLDTRLRFWPGRLELNVASPGSWDILDVATALKFSRGGQVQLRDDDLSPCGAKTLWVRDLKVHINWTSDPSMVTEAQLEAVTDPRTNNPSAAAPFLLQTPLDQRVGDQRITPDGLRCRTLPWWLDSATQVY